MFQIGETLISSEILEEEFICNLEACKGACCIEGDAGAPLLKEEIPILEKELSSILPYLDSKGKEVINSVGFYEMDARDGEPVTTCVGGKACSFVTFDEGKVLCGIEQAFYDNKTEFLKPISCHLYPIRLSKVGDLIALNYHKWDICSDACKLGSEKKVNLFEFLKEPLIRAFGEEWYEEVKEVAKAYKESKIGKRRI